ncbi:type II secretion system F family protein [Desulforamulus hydrothermalis]|uniref:Type II secretion system protein n=1 Tax=Desulforamulus hydrothermalis Lam5 = DSM 18033 TaxID=1121428 RepID=K8E6C3_9FIRM|nr:type II secretion system F family protein [Desulforamulus hydrothermalis]CCO07023.1 Type II secretion system protein [Desulforamulus hydrothermalis Lam5 = DSM 18033]SHG97369.1 tight adherence protein B [Desulforamulus hydrothermalis Lam5 = DSM 18033]
MSLDKIAMLVFIAGSLMILGIHQLLAGDRWEVNLRIKKLTAQSLRQRLNRNHLEDTGASAWRQLLERASRLFAKRAISKRMESELTKADIPLRGEEFVVLVLLAGLGSGLFFLMLTLNLVLGLIAALIGLLIPFFLVRLTRHKRLLKFNSQIGDALVIMSNSLRSGFSFLQAMDMVRKELPDPISKEFGRTFKEINLGTPAEEALQNMTQRVKSDDLDLLVTAVLIQRQVGGNLAEVLDNIAETIRERVRIKGQIRTLTAQGRISGYVIGLLPLALTAVMFVISPTYLMTLFTSPVGLLLVAAAVISELMGVFLIKKIVDIEV